MLLTEELRLRGLVTFRDFDSIQHGHRIELQRLLGEVEHDDVGAV